MHIFDPNGAIKAYRRERDRRETIRVCIFSVIYLCALGAGLCAVYIAMSIFDWKW